MVYSTGRYIWLALTVDKTGFFITGLPFDVARVRMEPFGNELLRKNVPLKMLEAVMVSGVLIMLAVNLP